MFISGICFCSVNVVVFSLTMKIFAKDKPEFWMVISSIMFGLGASVSPVFTIWLEINTYKIFALLTALVIPLVMIYPPPDLD